jgi:ribosome-associated toxin RatA of RatAB toxin-antitoxin module
VKIRPTYLFLAALTLCSFASHFQVDDWLLEREKKGIKVFTKKSRWGRLKDSKAEMFLPNARMDEMIKFISDFDNYPNWVPRCREAKVLARISDNEFIAYMIFKSPWPVADRDCVVRVRIDRDPVSGIVRIRETSEPKYINRKSNIVRIEQMFSTWDIVPQSNGLMVTNINSTNPGGSLPDWLTNTQSVDNPFDIFTTIQKVIPSSDKGKSNNK